jgi:hypothetical protein
MGAVIKRRLNIVQSLRLQITHPVLALFFGEQAANTNRAVSNTKNTVDRFMLFGHCLFTVTPFPLLNLQYMRINI